MARAAAAIAEGRTGIAGAIADAEAGRARCSAILVCRPSAGSSDARARACPVESWPPLRTRARRRPVEQLGGPRRAVLLKVYRRLETGSQPGARAHRVPDRGGRLRGRARRSPASPRWSRARRGTSTVAIAEAFVADASDAYESIAESLTAWLLAPGRGQRRVRDRGRRRPRGVDRGPARGARGCHTGSPTSSRGPRRATSCGAGAGRPGPSSSRAIDVDARRVRPRAARPGAADRGGAHGLRGAARARRC